ncbi:hypothetical protein Ga0609869_003442 [Rhodovulum iodosum]|uniref:Dihydroxy-acid dehydratase n=1 Tax=Rhodovulum iodosum TaxID=68291 RepID=A0ABV3XY47_9RHOB|nr:hypothetical protein [Rhodovulum robiginosum]RSK38083.1 hypothetical protein EJA01_02920 [Rhodovulum robiginosum]
MRRAAVPFAALALLAGCMETGAGAGTGGFAFSRAAPQRIAVSDATVVVVGPPGYCIDRRASSDRAEGAFVLLANCAALGGGTGAVPPVPAILTATVAKEAAPARPAARAALLRRYFASEAGRAALARDGRAASVTILETRNGDGLFLLHARDTSAGRDAGLRDDYWRAIFEVNGRVVTASVLPFEARPISDATALALLQGLAGRTRAASAAADGQDA